VSRAVSSPSSPAMLRGLALLALAAALALQVVAIHGHSLTGDGSYHLLAGHQALRYGQNTVNLEHPPLLKLLVALPLWVRARPLAPPVRVEDALAATSRMHAEPALLWSATVEARYLVLVFVVLPLLWACFALGRRFGNPATGTVLTLMVALSLGILPQLTILQNDAAVTLAFLLVVLACCRYLEDAGTGNALRIGAAWGLGLAVKFSAALLAPAILLSVLAAPGLARDWRRRALQLAALGLVAWAIVDVAYLAANRHYDRRLGREVIADYCENRGTLEVEDRLLAIEEPLFAVESVDPFLAQWLTGMLAVRTQNAVAPYAAYAFGEVRSHGRWWYFPAVLLVKTPVAVLLAALLALAAAIRRRPAAVPRRWLPVLAAVAVYGLVAMTSNYNLGVRHLLPVLPLLYLPVARFVARHEIGTAVLIGALTAESLVLAPLWMSHTNTWWLGARNPTRFALSAGNLEFRQNFVQLARYADRHGIEKLRVLYPTITEPVIRAYLPDARLVREGETIGPGWYAVDVIVEQFVPALLAAPPGSVYDLDNLRRAAQRWLPIWQAIARGEDHGYVAGTFHLYRVPDVPPAISGAQRELAVVADEAVRGLFEAVDPAPGAGEGVAFEDLEDAALVEVADDGGLVVVLAAQDAFRPRRDVQVVDRT
jgi:Dolichyl-phosphate-mannose-protein mannosyltransferase